MKRWMILLLWIPLLWVGLQAQDSGLVIGLQSGGVDIGTGAGYFKINCGTATFISNIYNCTTTGPAGATGATGSNGASGATGATGSVGAVVGPLALSGTTLLPFPNANKVGSIITATFGNSSAAAGSLFGVNSTATCTGGNFNGYWPISGVLRSNTVTTSAANGTGYIRGNINPDCAYNKSGTTTTWMAPGGVTIPPGTAAGAFMASSLDYYHIPTGSGSLFQWALNNGGTGATIPAIAMEFIDDAGTYATVLGTGSASALTASSTQFLGFYMASGGGPTSTELFAAVPVPYAFTAQHLLVCLTNVSPTNGVTVALNKNSVAQAQTVSFLAGATANSCLRDDTHVITGAAGDYIDISTVSGAATQTGIAFAFITVAPTSGTSTMLGGTFYGANVTTTNTFALPGVGSSKSTTQINNQLGLPMQCSAAKLYVVQAVANSGVTTTFATQKNGSDTAITGTITSSSVNALGGTGTGSIPVDISHSASYAALDLFDLRYVTGSGTSGTMGGWAASCN